MELSNNINLIDNYSDFFLSWNFSTPQAFIFLLFFFSYIIGSIKLISISSYRISRLFVYTFSGLILLAFSLVGPLDSYSDDLFTMHMAQHITLAMFAAPLILLGRPMPIYLWALPRFLRIGAGTFLTRNSKTILVIKKLTNPKFSLIAFILTLYFWHIPFAYNLSLENAWVHLFMHFTMFFTSIVFWWPIIGPPPTNSILSYPKRITYLLCAVTPTALLAAVITLSNSVIYDFYIGSPPHFSWTTLEDQKIAGLLMWIPGNLVYLTTLVSLFFKWFESEEKKIYKS